MHKKLKEFTHKSCSVPKLHLILTDEPLGCSWECWSQELKFKHAHTKVAVYLNFIVMDERSGCSWEPYSQKLKHALPKVVMYQITLDSDGWTSQLSSRNISCLSISYQVRPWVGFALSFCIFAVVWQVFAQPYCPCCSILQGIQFVFWQVEGQRPCQAVGSGNEAMPSVPSEGIVSQQGWCHQIGLPLKGSFALLLCDYYFIFFVLVCIICLYCQLREYTIDSE